MLKLHTIGKVAMSTTKNFWEKILILVIVIFLAEFIGQSLISMLNTPFNEFDEAHRAENAKRMWENKSFLVPVTGSIQDRVIDLRIPFQDDQFKFLYYHLERPPLIYDLMILSHLIFDSDEFGYRLPSFILGLMVIAVFIYFTKIRSKDFSLYAFVIGLICLVTSSDLWLSSQYAQLDTSLTAFLFLSFLSLITFVEQKKERWLAISAISFSLAVLSKGQPAILFSPVLVTLLVMKKINLKIVLRFILYSLVILLPWIFYISYKFGLVTFLKIFTGFALNTGVVDEIHHKAPLFWYARWWWESFRPGWAFFLSFLMMDVLRKNLNWQKITLISFVLINFLWLSLPNNKLWWYVLPLIPAACFYIYLSARDYLKGKNILINLGLALIIASRPPITGTSNKIALFYGLFFTLLVFYLLYGLNISEINFKIKGLIKSASDGYKLVFIAAVIFSLFSFYIRFPKIIPYHWNIKTVASYYANLPGDKCLWIYDIPPDSVLFYSNSGEIFSFTASSIPFGHCSNYLMTVERFPTLQLEYRAGNMKLYKL